MTRRELFKSMLAIPFLRKFPTAFDAAEFFHQGVIPHNPAAESVDAVLYFKKNGKTGFQSEMILSRYGIEQ